MEVYRGKKIKSLIGSKSKGKVLDIGCGLNNLFFKFKNYTGIDVRNYKGIKNIVHLDLLKSTDLPFKSNSFDIVMSTEFLEHITRPDLLALEINRVVKKNGVIIISLPNELAYGSRFGFLFGAVLNNGFNLYSHKYLFDYYKAKEFVNDHFSVIKESRAMMGIGSELLPTFLRDFLANAWPQMFSKSVIFKCRKKTS